MHTKGTDNPSDFLSRHTSLTETKREERMAEDYVNFILSHAVPRAMTMAELQEATKSDATLQHLISVIRSENWSEPVEAEGVDQEQFRLFVHVKDANADSNLLLRGHRIVIPASLHQRAVELAHEGHQGLVKTKKLLREKVWFPGIERTVKTLIQNCIACQANGDSTASKTVAHGEH